MNSTIPCSDYQSGQVGRSQVTTMGRGSDAPPGIDLTPRWWQVCAPRFANSENVARGFLKHPTMDTSPNGGWMGTLPVVEYLEFEGFRTTEKSSAVRGRGKVTESHFGLIPPQFCSRAEWGERFTAPWFKRDPGSPLPGGVAVIATPVLACCQVRSSVRQESNGKRR